MNRLLKNLSKSPFNTIYVEERAYNYPITEQLLQKYSSSRIIPIRHYKDVFNRTNQYFPVQKQHPSLILAIKDSPFLYRGPDVCQDFGHPNFYYTSFLLNCFFNCEYCYLQGMYPSANMVAFVNIEDFKAAISIEERKHPVFLAVSYDTDLIGFHNIIPYLDYFYDFFAKHPGLFIEIRTKSGNDTFYRSHTPLDNIIIAFTLTPEAVIKKYEHNTPPLEARIKAVKTAIAQGFKVRICLDPIFIDPGLDEAYESFYNHIFTEIDPDSIIDVGYGFFRMSREFFKRIEKQNCNSLLYSREYCINNGVVSYSKELQEDIKARHYEMLTQYFKKEKIFSL